MAIYRALKNLNIGKGRTIPAGSIFNIGRLSEKVVPILEKKHAIARIAAPPLSVLPGWAKRADALQKCGIMDAEQLLDASAMELAQQADIAIDVINKWQNEIKVWLLPPKKEI